MSRINVLFALNASTILLQKGITLNTIPLIYKEMDMTQSFYEKTQLFIKGEKERGEKVYSHHLSTMYILLRNFCLVFALKVVQ